MPVLLSKPERCIVVMVIDKDTKKDKKVITIIASVIAFLGTLVALLSDSINLIDRFIDKDKYIADKMYQDANGYGDWDAEVYGNNDNENAVSKKEETGMDEANAYKDDLSKEDTASADDSSIAQCEIIANDVAGICFDASGYVYIDNKGNLVFQNGDRLTLSSTHKHLRLIYNDAKGQLYLIGSDLKRLSVYIVGTDGVEMVYQAGDDKLDYYSYDGIMCYCDDLGNLVYGNYVVDTDKWVNVGTFLADFVLNNRYYVFSDYYATINEVDSSGQMIKECVGEELPGWHGSARQFAIYKGKLYFVSNDKVWSFDGDGFEEFYDLSRIQYCDVDIIKELEITEAEILWSDSDGVLRIVRI